jgi:hypothetical protein
MVAVDCNGFSFQFPWNPPASIMGGIANRQDQQPANHFAGGAAQFFSASSASSADNYFDGIIILNTLRFCTRPKRYRHNKKI